MADDVKHPNAELLERFFAAFAHYRFAQTGRPVVNEVRSTLRFADGLIAEQRDDFDFYRWSGEVLGPQGRLLGWTPFLRDAVRRKARAGLAAFVAEAPGQPGGQPSQPGGQPGQPG